MAASYYTAVELEKMKPTYREKRIDREQRTENSITEATLIPMDRKGEQVNIRLNLWNCTPLPPL